MSGEHREEVSTIKAFSWLQRQWEDKFLLCWQYFQKWLKTAKQCNRIHNRNSNNTTRLVWHNNWASKLWNYAPNKVRSAPWRALRAPKALKPLQLAMLVLWCGIRKSAGPSPLWCGLQRLQPARPRMGRKPKAAADLAARSSGPTIQLGPHRSRSFERTWRLELFLKQYKT